MKEKYIFLFIFLLILFYFILFIYINNYLKNIKMTKNKLGNIIIKFDYTPSEINKIKNSIIKNNEKWLNEQKINLKNNITNKDSKQFLNSYLYLGNEYDYVIQSISILQYVSDNDSIREASVNFSLDLSNSIKKMYEDSNNYKLFKYYLNNNFIKNSNDHLIKKICKDIFKQFENNGVHLDNKNQAKFVKISKELDLYENDFSQNIMKDTKEIKFSKVELDGISENVLKLHKDYIFTTSYPDHSEILKNCNVRDTRQKINFEFNTVAKPNLDLLVKILICRNNKSKLLNYESSCDYYLSDNHIATKNDIMKMINKVSPILVKLSKKESNTLVNFGNLNQLKEYDIAYYSNKLLKQKYNIDNNLVKEYFTPSYSIPKILSIYCKLFGLKCNLIKNCPKWHEDVFVYKFSDNNTNELMGYIYFDLYPRSKKYTHAMTAPLQNTYIFNNNNKQRIIPISTIVCNFDKKFMNMGEIETFCHEFGHGLHQILSKTQYELYAGTSTEADFTEMPSQLFENWCHEPSFLRKISSHYISHKKIPLDLAKKIQKNKNFNNGFFYLRQVLLSSYDLQVHSITNNQEITKDKLYNLWFELHDKLYSYSLDKNIYPMCRFEHLIGYEANYYSYMWTNIYAKDIFSQFKKNGIYDTKTGIKFRKEIFEKGGEVNGVEMIEGFLGRSVNEKAFFEMFH